MEKNAQEYVAFMEGVCDKLGCKEVLPSLKEGFILYLESIKEGESDEDKFPWMHQFDSITRVPCNKTDLMKSSQYYIVSKDNKFNVFSASIGGLSGPATTGYCISDVWFDEITVDRALPYKAPTFNVTIGGVKLKMNDVGILFGQHGEPIGKCHTEAELIDKVVSLNLGPIKEGDKPSFEGVSYSYKLNIQEPGKEEREFHSGNYDSSDRKRFAKNLSQNARLFGENAPRFNKPMTTTRKDGISVSLTPMKMEWDDAHYRYGIPKAICEKVAQMIDANGWDIDLDRSGVSYQGHDGHRGIPVAYRGKIDDPAVVAEISNALGPLGFKHEDDWVESKYGFTGSGPIDTETFRVDVWKYVGKPVENGNAVQPKQESISQYEQPKPSNIDSIIRDTNRSNSAFVKSIDDIQDAEVRDSIKATDVYQDASRPVYRRKVLKDLEKDPKTYGYYRPEGAPDSDYFANRDGYKSRSEFSKKPDAFHKLSPEVRSHLRHWVSRDGVSPSSIERVLELFPNLTGEDFDNINELAGPRGQYYIEKAAQCYKDHPELKQLMTDRNDRRLDCLWSDNHSWDDPEYRRLTNEIRQIAEEYGVWGTDESGERTAAADADGE